jgi:hypothetical protein
VELSLFHTFLSVKAWIERVEILTVELVSGKSQAFTVLTKSKRCGEALEFYW